MRRMASATMVPVPVRLDACGLLLLGLASGQRPLAAWQPSGAGAATSGVLGLGSGGWAASG